MSLINEIKKGESSPPCESPAGEKKGLGDQDPAEVEQVADIQGEHAETVVVQEDIPREMDPVIQGEEEPFLAAAKEDQVEIVPFPGNLWGSDQTRTFPDIVYQTPSEGKEKTSLFGHSQSLPKESSQAEEYRDTATSSHLPALEEPILKSAQITAEAAEESARAIITETLQELNA